MTIDSTKNKPSIPPEVRQMLVKKHAAGYSYQKLAEMTGYTYHQVRRVLTNGRTTSKLTNRTEAEKDLLSFASSLNLADRVFEDVFNMSKDKVKRIVDGTYGKKRKQHHQE
jgi:hypothetical protein